jgi:hypothetical protein
LHGKLQRSLAGDEDTSLDRIVLLSCYERSQRRARGVANAAEDRLVIHLDVVDVQQAGSRDAERGCPGFGDDVVPRSEVSS